jgi:hypothetical protein
MVTSNPSTSTDYAFAITIDSTYMYVVGFDYSSSSTDGQWRIEKRNLSDGALVSGFGTLGVVTSNPSTSYDAPRAIAIDSTYMYVVGADSSPGNTQWRIEKRNLSDGALASGFSTGGVATSNPSTYADDARAIVIDSQYMYVAGYDSTGIASNPQWRIEKRNLSDGALVNGFGTGGVVTSNPSAAICYAKAITIDSQYMYVAGFDLSLGYEQWRIEKRNLSDGVLVSTFGIDGVITSNPSVYDAGVSNIAIDSQYMYVVGQDSGYNNWQWRIEKRNLSDGALVSGFGTGGMVTSNPSALAYANAIVIDSTYMYVAGTDYSYGIINGQWRIEKRVK